MVSCPANAAGAPACMCSSGYSGALSFNTDTEEWIGTCSSKTFITVSLSAQFSHVLQTQQARLCALAIRATLERFHSAVAYGVDRVLVRNVAVACNNLVVGCPANAAGAPSCACSSGYSGALSFNTGTQAWSGSCTCKLLSCSCLVTL